MPYTKEVSDLVTRLDDSKRLSEIHRDYPTKFVWYVCDGNTSIRLRAQTHEWGDIELYPAFTADELIDIITSNLESYDMFYIPLRGNNHFRIVDILTDNLLKKSTESGNLTYK